MLLLLFSMLLLHPTQAAPRNVTCEYDVGVDRARYLDLRHFPCNSTEDCCSACQSDENCFLWVYAPHKDPNTPGPLCFLKKSIGGPSNEGQDSDRISMKVTYPTPPPPPKHWLPVEKWSMRYRNWTYYAPENGTGYVIPPNPLPQAKLTDCSVAFESPGTDGYPGRWRMFYTYFDGQGYQTALAYSEDLVHFNFSPGTIMERNPIVNSYDYGGVTFGCPLWENSSITSPRLPAKIKGPDQQSYYYTLYGAYAVRGGYEQGHGGQGVAMSSDGRNWSRVSNTVPALNGPGLSPWESHVVYQPNLALHNGTVYNYYNAAGVNQRGQNAEETGVAFCALDKFPCIDNSHNESLWIRYPGNPVLPSGPPGAFDTGMASDPKVFWDDEAQAWVMFYFGLGDGSDGHADILIAFSTDMVHWDRDPEPLYKAGGHPKGIDSQYAHKISIIYDSEGIGYLYYTAVGKLGRGIALLTSKPLHNK
eukprot:m.7531 g.7531  ORF g.7531 m.7531 type:complete len:475 (-) comp3729_c0_seq2:12-1436(-)